jgi:hypothetical protein
LRSIASKFQENNQKNKDSKIEREEESQGEQKKTGKI